MAMLAERRRKQKWSLNPRGKEWSEDTSKFGHRMLEKMGWKSGKGLGANLDGMAEHVKVSYKHDSKGVGYKETEQWTAHNEKFSELLKGLGEDSGVENSEEPPKSLEEISANSKKRVHYRKFTRGKDLSQYSEKQLANIFGKKSLKASKTADDLIEKVQNKNEVKKYGVDTLEGGSMIDYFKNKLKGKGVEINSNNEGFQIGNDGVLKKAQEKNESESDVDLLGRPSFGFGFKSTEEVDGDNRDKIAKQSKKRKLSKGVYDNANFNDSFDDSKNISIEQNPYEIKPKKKNVKVVLPSEGLEVHQTLKKPKKSIIVDGNSSINDVKIAEEKVVKLKKKKTNKITPIVNEEIILNTNNKKKKSPKKMTEFEDTPSKKSKRDKSVSSSTMEESNAEESAEKKSKKNLGVENPIFDLNDSIVSRDEVNEFEVKRRKKKAKQIGEISGLDNPALNASVLSTDLSYQEGLSTSMQQNLFQGIENLALNISKNDIDVIECDLMLNVAGLPDSAQKSKHKNVRFSGINQQFIIPNNYDNKLMAQKLDGLSNAAFDERAATLEENLMEIEQQLSTDCATVENDLNEVRAAAHARLLVPIIPTESNVNICHGNAGVRSLPAKADRSKQNNDKNKRCVDGASITEADLPEIGEKDSLQTHQVTPNGDIRLSYKLATLKMSNIPSYLRKIPKQTALASYKHLIKGDIILGFKKSNLHEIAGYGSEENNKDV